MTIPHTWNTAMLTLRQLHQTEQCELNQTIRYEMLPPYLAARLSRQRICNENSVEVTICK